MIVTQAPSLIWRIIRRLCVIGLIAAIIGYGFLFFEFSTVLNGLKNSTLYGEAEYLVEHLHGHEGTLITLELSPEAKLLYAGGTRRYRISLGAQTLFESDPAPALQHDLRLAHPGQTMVGFDDLVGVYERPIDKADRYVYGAIVEERISDKTLTIQIERETEHFSLLADTLLDEFFNDGGWLGIPFLIIVGLATIVTVVQTLLPLRHLSEQAQSIGPANPAGRLAELDVPREVLPLVRAVNKAVERLEHAFEAQRAFTADAAHELRTPLAILTMRLDALPPSDARTSLERDVAVMGRLVDQLLRGARLETLTLSIHDRADLHAIAQEVAEGIALVAIRKGVGLELQAPDGQVCVHGLAAPLYDALRNLVENAVSQTPRGKRVVIAVSAGRLAVIDQGPGISQAERPYLFQRFWQGRRKSGGAGLGLSIVQRVADLHNADLQVSETEGGGATFTLTFQPPPTEAAQIAE